jgi:DNA-binding XRE family transcriptional regulator
MTNKRISDLKTHDTIVSDSLADPEYREEWERTQFAHEVAMRIIAYRAEHEISQTELARRVGMRQPHIARLEAGEHEPSLATLARLSRKLGIGFHIDITPQHLAITGV